MLNKEVELQDTFTAMQKLQHLSFENDLRHEAMEDMHLDILDATAIAAEEVLRAADLVKTRRTSKPHDIVENLIDESFDSHELNMLATVLDETHNDWLDAKNELDRMKKEREADLSLSNEELQRVRRLNHEYLMEIASLVSFLKQLGFDDRDIAKYSVVSETTENSENAQCTARDTGL